MLKMPCFHMNTRPETFVPLIHCVIGDNCPKPYQTFVRCCFSSSTSWTWWLNTTWIYGRRWNTSLSASIKIKYKTIHHILLVLIYLQLRLGRLWNQTLHLCASRTCLNGVMSVANVSVHASMTKEVILAFSVTQEYTNN